MKTQEEIENMLLRCCPLLYIRKHTMISADDNSTILNEFVNEKPM